jgi:pyruvate dehydrogenase E2 component (dihydrolipoamide acetyltransferase)
MSARDFKLPDLGEGVHEGQIVRVHVAVGDVVREDQPLIEVETDKAAVMIPCPFAGAVQKVHVQPGQLVHVGEVMVTIDTASASTQSSSHSPAGGVTSVTPTSASPARRVESKTTAASSNPRAAQAPNRHKPASPAVRKLARELGIDINSIDGSGPGGRVQRADLQALAGATAAGAASVSTTRIAPVPLKRLAKPAGNATSTAPVAARIAHAPLPESQLVEPPSGGEESHDAWGPITRHSLTQARKTIARVMSQSWSAIPHATDCDDADVTELDKLRRGYTPPPPEAPDKKITLLAFVVRAVVRALQRFPEFNAYFDAETDQIVYYRYINIGIAVHTERGLIVPVLRDADRLTIPAINDELTIMAEKARTASFAVNDTRGGTYTISNAGAMGGSRYSTPIITPGQAAVLAIGRTRWMPWVVESESGSRGMSPRLIMPLSQSIDHRLLDGGHEIAFMQQVIGDLQNPARLLL